MAAAAVLPPVPADWGGGDGWTVSGSLAPPRMVLAECCGLQLDAAIRRWLPKGPRAKQGADAKDKGAAKEGAVPAKKGPKKKRVTSTKLTDAEQEGDHYVALQLEDKELEATEDDIRRAYKDRCMTTHPDKTGGDDTMFKAVQLASDVLLNPDKRRAYDSSLPFDDSIPPSKLPPGRFYKEFGECFARNTRWCALGRAKCPKLGDESMPIAQVDEFYQFWYSFKSWRDFSAEAAEHDLEDADDRYERRWMEKENAKAVEKLKKEENARVRSLVDRAYRSDPRIKKREEEEAAEKAAARERKQRAEEERRRKEAEEQERLRKEEEERKVAYKDMLQQLKKARQAFRKLVKDWPDGPEGDVGTAAVKKADLDWLLSKLDLEEIQRLHAAVEKSEADVPAGVCAVYAAVVAMEEKTQESRKGGPLHPEEKKKEQQQKRKEEKRKQEAAVTWSEEEMLELQKACVKYPSGTLDRWRKLSEFMMQKKTPEQCLKKVKQLETEYRMPQQVAKGEGLRSAGQKMPTLPSAQAKSSDKAFNEQDKWYRDTPERKCSDDAAEKFLAEQKKAGAAKAGHADPAAGGDGEAADDLADIWSASQQRQLESVLRDLKAYKEKDKWDKIAAAVDGKSKKMCVARYKFLSAAAKKK